MARVDEILARRRALMERSRVAGLGIDEAKIAKKDIKKLKKDTKKLAKEAKGEARKEVKRVQKELKRCFEQQLKQLRNQLDESSSDESDVESEPESKDVKEKEREVTGQDRGQPAYSPKTAVHRTQKEEEALAQLRSMGFVDQDRQLLDLLADNGGDVYAVINKLLES